MIQLMYKMYKNQIINVTYVFIIKSLSYPKNLHPVGFIFIHCFCICINEPHSSVFDMLYTCIIIPQVSVVVLKNEPYLEPCLGRRKPRSFGHKSHIQQ